MLVLEDFALPNERQALTELAALRVIPGDGYEGNPTPLCPNELFSGYVPDDPLSQEIMIRVRDALEIYFETKLWIGYVHTVQRRPIRPGPALPGEMSHRWHLDDVKYPWRTHTGILYLNDSYEGGATVFNSPYHRVVPQAGKLVGFKTAGRYHGVERVTQGSQYVLGVWCSTHPEIQVMEKLIISIG